MPPWFRVVYFFRMTYNNLFPQAYTKEDVAKAYNWLQTQPDYVKNMATNKETMVALYLKARRDGIGSIENTAPVSSKNFKSQLQSLASEMEQFDTQKSPASTIPNTNPPHQASSSSINQDTQIQNLVQEFQKPMAQTFLPTQDQKSLSLSLDPRSEQIIRSVKAQLNMDSEKDIIRMLLVLGYDRIKAIFPNR